MRALFPLTHIYAADRPRVSLCGEEWIHDQPLDDGGYVCPVCLWRASPVAYRKAARLRHLP